MRRRNIVKSRGVAETRRRVGRGSLAAVRKFGGRRSGATGSDTRRGTATEEECEDNNGNGTNDQHGNLFALERMWKDDSFELCPH